MASEICRFHGLLFRMFFDEGSQHHTKHVHCYYSEYACVFDIDTGDSIIGSLPKRQMRLAQAWIELNRDDLLTLWQLAQDKDQLFKIKPL